MNLTKLPRSYRETLAIFEALCRLGFDPDDIYFRAGPYEPLPLHAVIQVILNRPGSPKFVIDAGFISHDEMRRFNVKFENVIRIMNLGTTRVKQWRKTIWEKSLIGGNISHFIKLTDALASKGIPCPALQLLARDVVKAVTESPN